MRKKISCKNILPFSSCQTEVVPFSKKIGDKKNGWVATGEIAAMDKIATAIMYVHMYDFKNPTYFRKREKNLHKNDSKTFALQQTAQ
jgi:hypothetical protein